MKLKELCIHYNIPIEVYQTNKPLLKLLSYWMSQNLQLSMRPLEKKIDKLQKKVQLLQNSIQDMKKDTKKRTSSKQSGESSELLLFISQYTNLLLIHKQTYPVRHILKRYGFKWNPTMSGWVVSQPFQGLMEMLKEIKKSFPDLTYEESSFSHPLTDIGIVEKINH